MKNKMAEIEIELPKKLLLKIALKAHEMDITLNDFIIMALEWYINNDEAISHSEDCK
jgi:hypothetical protein